MPSFGQSITVCYLAFNQSTKVGQTGDAANHTLRLVKDGISAAPANVPFEVDATNAPGAYGLILTTAEAQHNVVTLCGKSSTANVTIERVQTTFESLPTAKPGLANGLWVLGTNVGTTTMAGSSAGQAALAIDGFHLINVNWGSPPLTITETFGFSAVSINGAGGAGVKVTNVGHVFDLASGASGDIFHCTVGSGGLVFNPGVNTTNVERPITLTLRGITVTD